jgi:histidine kinase/DNA gyrase B/HSP90-like ATPase
MEPEVRERAVDPFFTTKSIGQGSGLGLAMARGFAEQSAGDLQIESAPGRGTIVRLWFPVAESAAFPAAPLPAPESIVPVLTGAHARLLLVDDDAVVRETLAQQMEAERYVVLSRTHSIVGRERGL